MPYDVTVQVRNNGVAAYIDGKLAGKLATNYRGFGAFEYWQLQNRAALGIGTWGTPTRFDSLEVIEISGGEVDSNGFVKSTGLGLSWGIGAGKLSADAVSGDFAATFNTNYNLTFAGKATLFKKIMGDKVSFDGSAKYAQNFSQLDMRGS